jgi:phosphoribosylformylglycinamidine cyclo-ligase
MKMGLTYKDSGVDIEAGDALVEMIKPSIARTMRPEVIGGLGGFAGLFALDLKKYREPVLVSGTDGVGTKLKIAFMTGVHDTVGIDLVAMCVNDVLVTGAEPAFFLDYFATGRLDTGTAAQVIRGIANGCAQSGCALIGGETAELPSMYADGEYDLAGFAVGVAERSEILDGSAVRVGDQVVGLASTGLHSNGYSLARRALFVEMKCGLSDRPAGLERTVGEELLVPTRIYVKPVLEVMGRLNIKALAHITGSGLPGNVPRALPRGVSARLFESRWEVPPIFRVIAEGAGVERAEMFNTFNMGIGMIAVVEKDSVGECLEMFRGLGVRAWHIGEIRESAGEPAAEVL